MHDYDEHHCQKIMKVMTMMLMLLVVIMVLRMAVANIVQLCFRFSRFLRPSCSRLRRRYQQSHDERAPIPATIVVIR